MSVAVGIGVPVVGGFDFKLVINRGVLVGFGVGPIITLLVAPFAASGGLMLMMLAKGVAVLKDRRLEGRNIDGSAYVGVGAAEEVEASGVVPLVVSGGCCIRALRYAG